MSLPDVQVTSGDEGTLDTLILDNMPDGVIVYSPRLEYLYWNREMEALTGLGPELVLGQGIEIFPHLKENGIDRLLLRALKGETVTVPRIRFRVALTDRDGWYQGRYTPLRNATGEVVGVLGIVTRIAPEE